MKHPYVGLPRYQFWKKEPGIEKHELLDPVSSPPFIVTRDDRIVTAGSCFAQHVARYMSNAGFNHFVTEEAHPIISSDIATRNNYGMFAARYGNIYTARQLKQLLKRVYRKFEPIENAWLARDGESIIDPFRPQIQPGGYLSEAELNFDRIQHFSCTRRAIEEMDVFVFTLGLTEAWADKRDGAVFPLAPGIVGGRYDPKNVEFLNLDDEATLNDLSDALGMIRTINPKVRIILTVSPVSLNATYEDRHVLLSTIWSKAVLRIVAEKITQQFENCVYFPSYEIVTSPHSRGRYFEDDCREVTAEGVEHVMRLFTSHFTDVASPEPAPSKDLHAKIYDSQETKIISIVEALCDEEAIDNI